MHFLLAFLVTFAPATAAGPTAMDIRIHSAEGALAPPAHLLLVDSAGRRCGRDPETGETFAEIPGATYEMERIDDDETGVRGPETRILYLNEGVTGEYSLLVTGTETGSYLLEIRISGQAAGTAEIARFPGTLEPGEVNRYLIVVGRHDWNCRKLRSP